MGQSDAVVVDANVWLDYIFGNRAGNKIANRFITLARKTNTPLVIPSHSLKDVFYMIQTGLKSMNRQDGKLAPEEAAVSARVAAWAAIDFIMEIATVGPSDQADAIIASKNRTIHGDFEDNLVVACAQRINARWLVTNDQMLIMHSPVATLSPRDACSYLSLE